MEDSFENISFSEVLRSLEDTGSPFPARYLRSFSDLSRKNLKGLLTVWQSLSEERKVSLLEDLEEVLDSDTLVNFDTLARMCTSDPSPVVRTAALRLLWESEEPSLIPDLLLFSKQDKDESVRAIAASLLGKFALLGELDRIDASLKRSIEINLINIVRGDDITRVRQRALESLGYSSHPEVPALIETAYQSSDNFWIVSALCAMGRSADEAWTPQVEKMLISPEPDIQFEAIRAAGELELTSVREKLLSLLEEGIEDEEIRLALIWSLSQIGGSEVKEKLDELLSIAENEEEIDWIERAIENLDFSASGQMEMYDFSPRNQTDPVDEDEDFLDIEEDFDDDENIPDEDFDEDEEE